MTHSGFANRRERRTFEAMDRMERVRTFQTHEREPSNALERELVRIQELLGAELSTLAYRRVCEEELAKYVESWATTRRWVRLAEEMRACHTHGTVHLYYLAPPDEPVPDAEIYGHVIMWDHKCGQTCLCPFEARENQQRLCNRYVPAMLEWKRQKPGVRRLFYCVISPPNVPAGITLWQAKRDLMARFGTWMRQTRDVTDADRERYGWSARKKKMPRWLAPDRDARGPRAKGIHGAFVHQEDPLSRLDDWNVHLNVLFLVEGPFDFEALQAEWGCQVKIRDLEEEPVPDWWAGPRPRKRLTSAELRLVMLEVVKYAAELVASKSDRKGEAPPVVQWPPERFREWFRAQKPRRDENDKLVGSFRRTRSFGCLHGIGDPASTLDLDLAFPVGDLSWLGDTYGVSLIPGDNFSGSRAERRHLWRGDPHEPQPPPPHERLAA